MKNILITKSSIFMFLIISLFFISILFPLSSTLINWIVFLTFSATMSSMLYIILIDEKKKMIETPKIILYLSTFHIMTGLILTRAILLGQKVEVITIATKLLTQKNIFVGIALVSILLLINLILTKGINRTSEVMARFNLDSLPSRQMLIDAQLQQNKITTNIAIKKRKELDEEVEFYGNLDGTSKFTKGTVMLGIILLFVVFFSTTFINIYSNNLAMQEGMINSLIITISLMGIYYLMNLVLLLSNAKILIKLNEN